MPKSVFIITQHHNFGVHSQNYYCKSSHRQEEAEQKAECFIEQTPSCTAQVESGEEYRPDETGGDCLAEGRHGQGFL